MSNTATVTNSPGIPGEADAAAQVLIDTARRAMAELATIDPASLSADGLLRYQADLEGLTRLIDGGHIRAAAEISARSDRAAGLDGLAARHGCATVARLIEQVTGVSARTARQRVRIAALTAPRVSDAGLPIAGTFPAHRNRVDRRDHRHRRSRRDHRNSEGAPRQHPHRGGGLG